MLSIEVVQTSQLSILLGNLVHHAFGIQIINVVFVRGHVHPKVTEFDGADYREFHQLEDAQNSLKEKGFEDYEKFLKPERNASSSQPRGKYYAVAYGNMTGVFRDWK